MLPTLFCPDCNTFLSPAWDHCPACKRPHPDGDSWPLPGEPFWRARLGFAVRGVHICDNLAIFWGGVRDGEGGVAALERRSGEIRWRYTVPRAVEGGLACTDGRLHFGTIGFLGEGGHLVCLDAATGETIWAREQPAGVWSQPLIEGVRGLVGLDDGKMVWFDVRDGKAVSVLETGLKGRFWLLKAERQIIAFARGGQIVAIDSRYLRPLWARPLKVGAGITSPPVLVGKRVFFGVEWGRVMVLNLLRREIEDFAAGLRGIRGAPAAYENLLLVGATDHYLHAFDLQRGKEAWRSPEFDHSIVTAPAVADGLVAVAVNGGEVALLETPGGQIVWRYSLPVEQGLVAEPCFHQGVLYVGTDAGEVAALPWHLGRYTWAAERCAARGENLAAGSFFALASLDAQGEEAGAFRKRAVAHWMKSKYPEQAAYLLESDLDAEPEQIAVSYEQAGTYLAHQRPRQAVDFLLEAVRWYTEAGQEGPAKRCRRKASRLTRGPHLHITPVSVPTIWQQEVTFPVVVQVQNLGKSPAREIRIRFSGALHTRVWVNFDELPPHPDKWVEVEVPLAAHQSGYLVVEVFYRDRSGRDFSTTRRFAIEEVVPFEGIVIEKDAMVGLLSLDELPKKVVIRGDVGTFRVKPEPLTRQAQTGATFIWPKPPASLFGEPQELIRVVVIEDAYFTVPARYWAIFLADEAAMGRFSPGRYERKKFPPLRGRWSAPRPVWKAVLFTLAPFRLAYRLEPFRTKEGVPVGVECGLTAIFDQGRPYEAWKGILGEKDTLTTDDLARWLEGEIRGALAAWVAKQTEATLSPAFDRRERVMLNLLETLRETTVRYGIQLVEPMYHLNFVNPQREKVDDLRAAVYWQEETRRTGVIAEGISRITVCRRCGMVNDGQTMYCTTCGARLRGGEQ